MRDRVWCIIPRCAVAFTVNLKLVDTARRFVSLPSVWFFPLEAMAVTGKSKSCEAGRRVLIARAEAWAAQLLPVVPTASGRRGATAARGGGKRGKIEERRSEFPHRDHGHQGRARSRVQIDCGDKHVTAAGKGPVRMRGNFEHPGWRRWSRLHRLHHSPICNDLRRHLDCHSSGCNDPPAEMKAQVG